MEKYEETGEGETDITEKKVLFRKKEEAEVMMTGRRRRRGRGIRERSGEV